MNDPTPPGRPGHGRLVGLIVVLLLVTGSLLLIPALNRFIGSARWSASRTLGPTRQSADRPTEDAPAALDGKLLPSPSPDDAGDFSAIPANITQLPVPANADEYMAALYDNNPPAHDYFKLAEMLGGLDPGERKALAESADVGDRRTFHTHDGARQAELIYQDTLAEYWMETGISLDRSELVAAAQRLREHYYPLLAKNIGAEWDPDADNDPRFIVLLTLGAPDTYELGYFSDEDQYPQALFPSSNEREMVYLNMSQLTPGPLFDGTLVHEVQHLIQWNLDPNEDKWLNEGLSQIAETMSGLDTVDPRPYLEQTQIRLDGWSKSPPDIYAHYAGSYLYLLYLWEQLDDAAIAELARHPANGLAAVRDVLAGHDPTRSLESFTADWAAALYLDGRPTDPRYNIEAFELSPPFFANRVRQLPYAESATLDQFGVDLIDLDFSGKATLTFAGDTAVELTGAPPDGLPFWFAPPSNSSDSRLSTEIDLTSAAGATLNFLTWYDLEPAYDFAYFSVSADGGKSWRPLDSVYGILGAYGPAWGGRSAEMMDNDDGWLAESINLDAYAGQKISLRFDVVTDFEGAGRGFAVSAPVIAGVAEQPAWQPDGFVKTGHLLPQRWEVRLIRDGNGGEVLPLHLDDLNRIQTEVELGPEGGALIVMPLTPFVETAADYWLSVNR